MDKQKVTFDQLFQSVIYQEILAQGITNEEFKIIIDSSQFQEEDMLNGYTIVMVKSYGGNRINLAGIDATPLAVQLIINTDNPQNWKRVINTIGGNLNGKWNSIRWEEDDKLAETEYSYFSTINTPMQAGGGNVVGTSTRYTIVCTGTIYYTSSVNTLVELKAELYDEIKGEYSEIGYIVNGAFGYTHQTESYQSLEANAIESETKGMARQVTLTYVYNKNDKTHKAFNKLFFNGSQDPVRIKVTFDGETVELYMFAVPYQTNYVLGSNASVNLTLTERSEING